MTWCTYKHLLTTVIMTHEQARQEHKGENVIKLVWAWMVVDLCAVEEAITLTEKKLQKDVTVNLSGVVMFNVRDVGKQWIFIFVNRGSIYSN